MRYCKDWPICIPRHPEVVDALTNPLYPMDVKEKVMTGIVGSMEVDTIMGNFLNLLVQKKRAEILPEIAEAYQDHG